MGLRDVGLIVGLLVTGDVSGFVVVGGAVGVPVLAGDRVGPWLGPLVGPATATYLTVISCGAAQVPPKYNPSTDPCS